MRKFRFLFVIAVVAFALAVPNHATATKYCYSENGFGYRPVIDSYQAQAGEVLFPDLATDAQLAAAFPQYGAAKAFKTLQQQAQSAIATGLPIVSTSHPEVNGTYAVDTGSRYDVSSIIAGITAGLGLPGGGATFFYHDVSGVSHPFDAATFTALGKAMRDYIYLLGQVIYGTSTTMPTTPVTIP